MDVVIEVEAAEGMALMTAVKTKTVKVIAKVVTLIGVVTTSILRTLRQGRTSLSAVSPDLSNFKGGLAVA